jgi:hypothetical protein
MSARARLHRLVTLGRFGRHFGFGYGVSRARLPSMAPMTPSRNSFVRSFVLALAALGLFGGAAAQDGDLYGPAIEAAFVRVVNAGDTAEVTVGERALGALATGQVTPYYAFPAGSYPLVVGGAQQEVGLELFLYYTVVVHEGGVAVLQDAPLTDPARALLSLYNLSGLAAADLVTADGSTEVITGVPPLAGEGVEVNAAEVDLAVRGDGEVIETLQNLDLTRGEAYSAFVLGTGEVLWVQAEVVVD